jgi:hypothetical protein
MVAPGAAALLLALLMPGYDGLPNPLERFWRSAQLYGGIGAYPTALIFGVPAYFALRRHFAPKPLTCAATGAIVAALPWLVLGLISSPDYASSGGHVTHRNGAMTLRGWFELLKFVGLIGAMGIIGGWVFWAIAAAGGPLEERNSDD